MAMVLFVSGFISTCFGPFPGPAKLHILPETEQASRTDPSLTISPDDHWLVFSEYTLTSFEESNLPDPANDFRLSSINLHTGEKAEHLLPKDLTDHEHGYWGNLNNGHQPGWHDGFFVVEGYGRNKHLILDPRRNFIQIGIAPDGPGTCSDCQPHEIQIETGENISLTMPGGTPEVVVKGWPKKRFLKATSLRSPRLSPNGRYLVYSVYRREWISVGFGSGGTSSVYLKDLETGREKKLSEFYSIGNMAWTSNSQCLYFAGKTTPFYGLGAEVYISGIFEVKIADVFGD